MFSTWSCKTHSVLVHQVSRPSGFIRLKDVLDVREAADYLKVSMGRGRAYDVHRQLILPPPPSPLGQAGRPHCFLIRTASSVYYMMAASKDEMQGWIDAISELQATQNASTAKPVLATSPVPAATRHIGAGTGSGGRPVIRKESSVELVPRDSDRGRSRSISAQPERRLTMDIDEGDDDTDANVYGM